MQHISVESDCNHDWHTVVCTHCSRTFKVPVPCKNRFCSVCKSNRKFKAEYKLKRVFESIKPLSGYNFKFVTLSTVSQESARDAVEVLVKSFRRLRQRAFWKSKVRGGVFVIEVTYSKSGYHAHLHIICHSRYLSWDKLQFNWNHCSGGLSVYIQNLPTEKAINYACKYIGKCPVDEEKQLEVSAALKGTRLVNFFGSFHGLANAVKVPHSVCPHCGNTHFMVLDFIHSEGFVDVTNELRKFRSSG